MKKIDEIKDIDKDFMKKILKELAKKRPIFHNEQDFQFELAREISEYINNDNIKVRLEYFIGETEKKVENKAKKNRIYVDIMIIDKQENKAVAIELKYKERKTEFKFENEYYSLKEHGARDWGCYYIFTDLKRIEDIINNNYNLKGIDVAKGYVIFLTNDSNYRNSKNKLNGIFHNYSLNEKENTNYIDIKNKKYKYCKLRTTEEVEYEEICNEYGSVKNKEPIEFKNTYLGEWSEYSKINKEDIGKRKDEIVEQLIFEIEK